MSKEKSVQVFISPPMDMQAYADASGLTKRTVTGMVDKGYLPTIKRGKRRLINTYALAAVCLQDLVEDFDLLKLNTEKSEAQGE